MARNQYTHYAAEAILLLFLSAPIQAQAQNGNVVFWNKLDGSMAGSPSEIGPDLSTYNPSIDGRTNCCDVIGNVQFVPGKFGNAVTLGSGNYYSTARVHALTLRNLSEVLNPDHGAISIWYNEKKRPLGYQHNIYRIFDGSYGLDSPISLFTADPGNLVMRVRFGGQDNQVTATFLPNLNDWNHIAGVWDRDGIEGSSETVRLYINGLQVAAIQSNLWGTGFNGNRADIAGGNDFIANTFTLDNLVIFDYAKTDFADRLMENPIGCGEGDFAELSAIITKKSGVQSSRFWTITLANKSGCPAENAQIDVLDLTQTSGTQCAPIITNPLTFPLGVGNIPANSQASGMVSIDFTGCPNNTRFRADIDYSSNNGAVTGSKTLNNQFR
jgi:hypothetical protein